MLSRENRSIVICLMGPTASGKTQFAMECAQRFPVEIISVDSAMIYRGMDIGSAKPSVDELAQVPHRLINICDPSEIYSAGQFFQDASEEIITIHSNGKIPLLVGGTMLYFHVLQHGLATLPSADPAIREKILQDAQQLGWPKIHERLQQIDPVAAQQIHLHDTQRMQRALEVYYITGKTISSFYLQQNELISPFQFINIILTPDRFLLHQRIEHRFQMMLKKGLIEEVKKLYQRDDIHADLPSMRTVNYRQVWSYLSGEYNLETLQQRAVAATRQLAKRQFTWSKRWPEALRLDPEKNNIIEKIKNLLF